jgi:hypothetical protein
MSDEAGWEIVVETPYHSTSRLVVPGGWLYREIEYDPDYQTSALSMVFVPNLKPEVDHDWSPNPLLDRLRK